MDTKAVDAVDRITRWHGRGGAGQVELDQLGRLFHPRYLRSLHRVLDNAQQTVGPRRSLDVKLAWIDKIPVAEVALKKPWTELGDAAIFAIEGVVSPSGVMGGFSARAVLLQAKIAEAKNQVLKPRVPIAAMRDSTKREYDLLSGWPSFNLYKAGGSKPGSWFMKDVDLRGPASGALPFGWYIAAPRPKKQSWAVANGTWPSWWMAGPPVVGHACDTSFGRFLQAALSGDKITTTSGDLAAGEPFRCASYPPTTSGATGWDRVCAEIIRLAEGGSAPQYIATSSVKRLVSMPQALNFLASPSRYPTILAHGRIHIPHLASAGMSRSRHPALRFWDARRWMPPLCQGPSGDRGMYVLVVRSLIHEG